MDADWITSPSARRVQQHAADQRPAWLWSQDGARLIWRNAAAGLFLAKLKKHGLKLAPPAIPIKGQVGRNIRLGSLGRTSLARIQFQAGDKPTSTTCATTPLTWEDGQLVLLVVGVDPIAAEIWQAAVEAGAELAPGDAVVAQDEDGSSEAEMSPLDVSADAPAGVVEGVAEGEAQGGAVAWPDAAEVAQFEAPEPVEPDDTDAVVAPESEPAADAGEHGAVAEPMIEADAEVALGEAIVAADEENRSEAEGPALDAAPDAQAGEAVIEGQAPVDEVAAWSDAADLVAVEAPEPGEPASIDAVIVADETAYARELESWRDAEQDVAPAPADDAVAEPVVAEPEADVGGEAMAEPEAELSASRLSRLVDRLAADEALYTPLSEADDQVAQNLAPSAGSGGLFQVTGRGFIADRGSIDAEAEQVVAEMSDQPLVEDTALEPGEPTLESDDDVPPLEEPPAEVVPETPDAEAVERVSRYNFDELSRILNDRVGETGQSVAKVEPQRSAALINLGGETLVLNRLPLGILVFRDQHVLFANRAITEMVGYDSVETLRQAGLAAVFPAGDADGQGAGPVNHLVQRDGTLVPVTARLQSISWQGRPALMLSASATEVRTGHEAAVNAFAQSLADMRGDGFFEATRIGVISSITAKAASLLGSGGALEGRPLTGLIAIGDMPALRAFLERPARFAETARPCLTLRSASGKAEVSVFAQGQAGVITGYFGFVRGRDTTPVRSIAQTDADPALLSRISRGVRRPLNTIIGFADLLREGGMDAGRLQGYARDIGTAGQEIAALVDELEDYARLRDGRYLPQRASVELTVLLESCVVRIRRQASSARVFVRNAISETLPRITADRASLAQAVLNLLASAIDQTPTGGAVVISAQRMDDGGIAVHVRDSSTNAVDLAERFVVFRDGIGKDGQMLAPVRSSVGLALTRSLLAVNAFSLSVDPAGEQGLLFTLVIPAELVEKSTAMAE